MAGVSVARCKDAATASFRQAFLWLAFLVSVSAARCKEAAAAKSPAGISVARCKDAAAANLLAGVSFLAGVSVACCTD